MRRKFDFLLHNGLHHSFFRTCLEQEHAKKQKLLPDAGATAALPGIDAYGNSDTSDSDDTADDSAKAAGGSLTAASTSNALRSVPGLGNPITAATLAEVKPPKAVTVPADPTVLAMMAKLLEFRRTFNGSSWSAFLLQLQQQESARSGPNRFTFLAPESAHHNFWLWAVQAAIS